MGVKAKLLADFKNIVVERGFRRPGELNAFTRGSTAYRVDGLAAQFWVWIGQRETGKTCLFFRPLPSLNLLISSHLLKLLHFTQRSLNMSNIFLDKISTTAHMKKDEELESEPWRKVLVQPVAVPNLAHTGIRSR
jgi:hypothetical protein